MKAGGGGADGVGGQEDGQAGGAGGGQAGALAVEAQAEFLEGAREAHLRGGLGGVEGAGDGVDGLLLEIAEQDDAAVQCGELQDGIVEVGGGFAPDEDVRRVGGGVGGCLSGLGGDGFV